MAQLGIAENAGNVIGQTGRQRRELPACPPEYLRSLKQPAISQGSIAFLGQLVGTSQPIRGKLARQTGRVEGGTVVAILRLKLANLCSVGPDGVSAHLALCL